MTQWDSERTKFLISLKPTILGHYKSLPKIAEQISKIFDIVEVVLKTFTASHKIRDLLEKLIRVLIIYILFRNKTRLKNAMSRLVKLIILFLKSKQV